MFYLNSLSRTEVEEVTIDSGASWKPVSIKQEVKQEDAETNSCASSTAPPPKRLKSVDSSIASPMSITNPSTPGSFKPPTPARPCTPSSAPKTPQNNTITATTTTGDSTFAVPSPMDIHQAVSQPQLIRQQSLPATGTSRPDPTCHLTAPGIYLRP